MLSKRHIIFVPLIVLLLTAGLYADGCFVWRKGADLNEPTQKAIIYWKKGKEIMVLQVKYEGAAEDFAWIVPLPARPKVSAIDVDKSPFAEISLYTQLRRRWGYRGKDAGAEAEAKVTVLERKIVGVYDIAILAASDAKALGEWLNNNGYAFPEKRKDVLEHYTKKKWVYVAMRIDRKALESDEVKKLKSGELQPIRFTFAAKEMVYPLKISSVNAGETEVLLYVLADAPMVVKGEYEQAGLSIEENISYGFSVYTMRYRDPEYGTYRKAAGKELPLTWEALGLAKDKELSLCKYRAVYRTEEMTDDLVFTRFEPMPYWRKRFSREPHEQDYKAERERKSAFIVLAWHERSLLQEFAKDKYSKNRELVAMHPKASERLLIELAKEDDYRVKYTLVTNSDLPVAVLKRLTIDEDWRIREGAARHHNTSIDLIEKLVKDKSVYVRRSVVHHHAITRRLLEILSKDPDEYVRASVAYNQRTSVNLLRKLANDKSPHVRACVAQQTRLPEELLEELARDNFAEVRKSAAFFGKVRAETLIMLASDESRSVRAGAAYNSRTPVEALRKLAKDKEKGVRSTVAGNPNTPEELLRILAKDKDANVSKDARLALEERGL